MGDTCAGVGYRLFHVLVRYKEILGINMLLFLFNIMYIGKQVCDGGCWSDLCN